MVPVLAGAARDRNEAATTGARCMAGGAPPSQAAMGRPSQPQTRQYRSRETPATSASDGQDRKSFRF